MSPKSGETAYTQGQAAKELPTPAGGAELVLVNGKIWTGEPASPLGSKPTPARFATTLAIANGRIIAVGSNAEVQPYVSPKAKIIDLKGRLAVPGLIDSHAHFILGGFQLLEIDLRDARSEAEFTQRIRESERARAGSLAARWRVG